MNEISGNIESFLDYTIENDDEVDYKYEESSDKILDEDIEVLEIGTVMGLSAVEILN